MECQDAHSPQPDRAAVADGGAAGRSRRPEPQPDGRPASAAEAGSGGCFEARPDGRHISTAGGVYHRLAGSEPRLAFDPSWSAAEIRAWQPQLRAKLADVLQLGNAADGGIDQSAETQPSPRLLAAEERHGYQLQRWESYPEPGAAVPFLLLVPAGASAARPVPLVHSYPGTDHSKELLAGELEVHGVPSNQERHFQKHNRMAWWYVRAGWAALCVDNPATREQAASGGPGRSAVALALLDLGSSYLALSVQQRLQLLHWSRTLPFVDQERIALSGHSLGTGPALAIAVLEPDVRAVVFNSNVMGRRRRALATGLEPQPAWHSVPAMLRWFDRPDLLCALAPRPLLVTEGGLSVDLARSPPPTAPSTQPTVSRSTTSPRHRPSTKTTAARPPPVQLEGAEALGPPVLAQPLLQGESGHAVAARPLRRAVLVERSLSAESAQRLMPRRRVVAPLPSYRRGQSHVIVRHPSHARWWRRLL